MNREEKTGLYKSISLTPYYLTRRFTDSLSQARVVFIIQRRQIVRKVQGCIRHTSAMGKVMEGREYDWIYSIVKG